MSCGNRDGCVVHTALQSIDGSWFDGRRTSPPARSLTYSLTPYLIRSSAHPLIRSLAQVSLGCPKNTVDGEVILGDLFRSGFEITDEHEEADAIVVNTCGFVEDAKSDSLENIIQAAALKSNGKVKKVVVTGCMAQRYNEELAESLPEIDLVVGFESYGNLSSSLREVLGAPPEIDENEYLKRGRVQVGESTIGFRPEHDRFRLTPKHFAYLRVAEGCSHACTFCAIPGFRYVSHVLNRKSHFGYSSSSSSTFHTRCFVITTSELGECSAPWLCMNAVSRISSALGINEYFWTVVRPLVTMSGLAIFTARKFHRTVQRPHVATIWRSFV